MREGTKVAPTILDLEHTSAEGAVAELLREQLKVRRSFRLTNAPNVKSLASVGRGKDCYLKPMILAVEYAMTDGKGWVISAIRLYGNLTDKPDETAVNIYPHIKMDTRSIPAWVRDAAYAGVPKRKQEDER